MKVALISAPFADRREPSLALGLFQALLKQLQIESKQFYLSLDLLRVMGKKYCDLAPLADWMATRTLYPQNDCDCAMIYSEEHPATTTHPLLAVACRSTFEAFLDAVAARDWDDYKIFAFTTSTFQMLTSLAIAKRLKQKHPDKLVVIGGPNVFGECGISHIQNQPFIDAVFLREAERSFPEWVARIANGQTIDQASNGLPSFAYRAEDGQVVVHPMADYFLPMDEMPNPDFSDWTEAYDNSHAQCDDERSVLTYMSRGCSYGASKPCRFCCESYYSGNRVFLRSPTNALSHLRAVVDANPQITRFTCVDQLMPKRHIHEVYKKWPEVRSRNVALIGSVSPILSKEEVRILQAAGFVGLTIGFESFHPEILKLLGKGQQVYHNLACLKWIKEQHITAYYGILMNVPGELPEYYDEMSKLIPRIRHFQPPDNFNPIKLMRYSAYWRENDPRMKNRRASQFDGLLPYNDEASIFWEYDLSPTVAADNFKRLVQTEWMTAKDVYARLVGNCVYDTRSGVEERISLTKTEHAVMLACDSPASMSQLRSQMPDEPLADILSDLEARTLIYTDGEVYLSLLETEGF